MVLGLGAAGSATLYALAQRGVRVLGIDQFAPPHALGSSHGRSRIIREAYFEDARYVPLVQHAYARWRALEARSGELLLRQTGGLMIGRADSALVLGAKRSAEQHELPHEALDRLALARRAPAFHVDDDTIGVFEPRAGVLDPEEAIAAMLREAVRAGATVHTNETLLKWRADADVVEVTTSRRRYTARRAILALGPWATSQLHGAQIPLSVERNVLYWFDPLRNVAAFAPSRFPVFLFEVRPDLVWYGFPDLGDGVKIALHGGGEHTTAGTIRRDVSDHELANIRSLLQRYLPDANGALREVATCMYTNTPDGHFVIDHHPAHHNVIVASPCSGHGFKFAPAVGELIADLALSTTSGFDRSLFSATRFADRADLENA